jgi:peptidoglycan-associated lipoprotein
MSQDEAARRERERQAALAERERAAQEEAMRRRGSQSEQDFVNEDVHFAYDQFDLDSEARAILERKATWLTTNANVRVQIEGHCDERGTNAYNLALGERRANAARQYLTVLGVSAARMSTISYGEERPLDPGHTEDAWAQNRRAHFVIMGGNI